MNGQPEEQGLRGELEERACQTDCSCNRSPELWSGYRQSSDISCLDRVDGPVQNFSGLLGAPFADNVNFSRIRQKYAADRLEMVDGVIKLRASL
jgi:hypothetical protein